MYSNSEKSKIIRIYCIFILLLILTFIAGTRTIGVDPDSLQYATLVDGFHSLSGDYYLQKEPGFWLIVWFSYLFSDPVKVFFLLYALVAIIIKFSGFYKFSPYPFLSILMYIGFYYILQEMTQIRIGLASGFLLYAYYFLAKGDKKRFLITAFISVIFHYSTIILLAFYFLNPNKKIGLSYLILPVLGFGISQVGGSSDIIRLLFSVLPSFITYKAGLYFNLQESGGLDNRQSIVFGFGTLFLYGILLFFYFKKSINNSDGDSEKINILLKITSVQIFLGFILSFNSEFSSRIYSYIGVLTFTILPAYFMKQFNYKWVILIFLILYSMKQFYTSYTGLLA